MSGVEHIMLFKAEKEKIIFTKGRYIVYVRDKENPKKLVKTERFDWGNYLSYVYLAAKIMNEPAIKKQVSRHQRVLKNYLDKHQTIVDEKKIQSIDEFFEDVEVYALIDKL